MSNFIKFLKETKSLYDAQQHDASTLYLITDNNQICFGDNIKTPSDSSIKQYAKEVIDASFGIPNGIATLDAAGKVPTSLISILPSRSFIGLWNAASGNAPSENPEKGQYWICNNPGTFREIEYGNGDEINCVSTNPTVWDKLPMTEFVRSINTKRGDVTITKNDISLENVDNTSDMDKPLSTASKEYIDNSLSSKANISSTLAGYGIQDTKIENGKIILGDSSIQPIAEDKIFKVIYGTTTYQDCSNAISDKKNVYLPYRLHNFYETYYFDTIDASSNIVFKSYNSIFKQVTDPAIINISNDIDYVLATYTENGGNGHYQLELMNYDANFPTVSLLFNCEGTIDKTHINGNINVIDPIIITNDNKIEKQEAVIEVALSINLKNIDWGGVHVYKISGIFKTASNIYVYLNNIAINAFEKIGEEYEEIILEDNIDPTINDVDIHNISVNSLTNKTVLVEKIIELNPASNYYHYNRVSNYTTIIDNLISDSSIYALSAKQGKALQEQLNQKANISSTLAGYGIQDAYTKTYIDTSIENINTLLATKLEKLNASTNITIDELNNISATDTNDTFIATYGVTTYTECLAAVTAKKTIIVEYLGITYYLKKYDNVNNIIYFKSDEWAESNTSTAETYHRYLLLKGLKITSSVTASNDWAEDNQLYYIGSIYNNLTSDLTQDALSAKLGKELKDHIDTSINEVKTIANSKLSTAIDFTTSDSTTITLVNEGKFKYIECGTVDLLTINIPQDPLLSHYIKFTAGTGGASIQTDLIWGSTIPTFEANKIYLLEIIGKYINLKATETPFAAETWYLPGEFNSWSFNDNTLLIYNTNTGYYEKTYSLNASTTYEFKITHNSGWSEGYGNIGTYTKENVGLWWPFETSKGNCKLTTDAAGDYTFKWNASEHKLQITFPS